MRLLRRPAYAALGIGTIYVLDEQLSASSLTRTLRTFGTGALIALDYKVNFRPDPLLANSLEELHSRNAERIHTLLRTNGGLYLKMGQAIAMQAAVLPPQFQARFARFFDDAPHNDWPDVERVIRAEFGGRSPEEVFGAIEHTPRASASVAQVHFAKLPDGRTVAVKVQKHEIVKQLRWDLWAFKAVMYLYDKFFDLPLYPLVPYISERLRSETDFLNEADNARRATEHIAEDEHLRGRVYIPRVYKELSTHRVMTAEWIDGARFTDKAALAAMNVKPADVVNTLIDFICAQIFLWGDVHCDPHPGNLFVRRTSSSGGKDQGNTQLVVIDHGLYVRLESSFRRQYAAFWRALLSGDRESLQHTCSSWGIRSGADSDAFASATLLRPVGRTAASLQEMSHERSDGSRVSAYEAQERMRRTLRGALGAEAQGQWPRALIFLARAIRILQGDNQLLGSPVNRVGRMGLWASRACAEDDAAVLASAPSTGAKMAARWHAWLARLRFRTALLVSDAAWFVSRVRQLFGLGEGMESDVEAAMRTLARNTFGVELNREVFDG